MNPYDIITYAYLFCFLKKDEEVLELEKMSDYFGVSLESERYMHIIHTWEIIGKELKY